MSTPAEQFRGGIDTGVQMTVECADAEVSLALQQTFFADIASRYAWWEPASSQSVEPSDLAPPDGIWLVAYREGTQSAAAACSGSTLRRGRRRIFLDQTARGRGTGRRLLAELEEHARRLGYKRVRLTTGDRQPEALRMFQSAGYEEIRPFTDGAFTAPLDGETARVTRVALRCGSFDLGGQSRCRA